MNPNRKFDPFIKALKHKYRHQIHCDMMLDLDVGIVTSHKISLAFIGIWSSYHFSTKFQP